MEEEQGLSFWEHLEELRWALFRVAVALFAAVIAVFIAMPHIFDSLILGPTTSDFFLYRFFSSAGGKLPFLPDFSDAGFAVDIININVASQFMTHISTSFWMALVLVFPYFIYQVWGFIRPALFPEEVRNIRLAFLLGTGMFYLGCIIGYCVIFPFTFRFLVEYQISESIVNQINLNSYTSMFVSMIFIMGLIFELPLLAWVLSKLGFINKETLKGLRRYAVVVLLIISAFITPTSDPFTLSLIFVPLYLLYEFSILIIEPAHAEEETEEEA